MRVVDGGQLCTLVALLSHQGGIIDLGYLHGHAQSRVLAARQIVGSELWQQVMTDGLQVVVIAPLPDKLIKVRIDIGSLGIATGRHQIFAAIDAPIQSLGVVALGILGIIAGGLGLLTTHLKHLCTVEGYQGAQCLYLLLNHLGLLLIECYQRVHAIYPYASLVHVMVQVADGDIL